MTPVNRYDKKNGRKMFGNFSFLSISVTLAAAALLMGSCTLKYSFGGMSIPLDAKTVSVAYFPNNAPMVAPMLSATMTDALQERFQRQTKLRLVREGGDFAFEGEITGYTSTPASITATGGQGGTEGAATNRLTIQVRVRFTNVIEPKNGFERTFQAFTEYSVNQPLQTVEARLIPEIVDMLVDDIFNAATSNW